METMDVISFMFTDQQLFRFISNMFWLWSFGYILQDLTGNRKLVPVYLYGGIGGAIIYVMAHVLIPEFFAVLTVIISQARIVR